MTQHESDTLVSDETLDDVFDRLDPAAQARAARMAEICGHHLRTGRDKEIDQQIGLLIEGAAVEASGGRDERRLLMVIGGTGAGKSTLCDRAIRSRPELEPQTTATTRTAPLIRVRAPSPCTPKLLAHEMLDRLEYPFQTDLKEAVAWRILRHQLKTRRVRFVHLDEAQHMLNMADRTAMRRLSDALKTLIDSDDWPVRLIASGTAELADFLTIHPELRRRSHTLHLRPIEPTQGGKLIGWTVSEIVENHAKMNVAFPLDADFLARLCHAAGREFGATIQIVRGAVARALVEDPAAARLERRHFAKAYELFSGCARDDNVFTAADWRTIEPTNALLSDEEMAHVRAMKAIEERQAKLRGRSGRGKGGSTT